MQLSGSGGSGIIPGGGHHHLMLSYGMSGPGHFLVGSGSAATVSIRVRGVQVVVCGQL